MERLKRIVRSIADYLRAMYYVNPTIKKIHSRFLGPIRARWVYGIGPKPYALFNLIGVAEAQWSNYVMDEPLKKLLYQLSRAEDRLVANDKSRFHAHCLQHKLATPEIIGVMLAQPTSDSSPMRDLASARDFIQYFSANDGKYFFKLIDGSHGRHAFGVSISHGKATWHNQHHSVAVLHQHCEKILQQEYGWIIQRCVANHKRLRELMSSHALSTIRVVSVLKDGEFHLIAACIRLIVGANEVDNFSHGASGNLAAAVDVETGTLLAARGSLTRHWPQMVAVRHHPVSNIAIEGFQLPYWQESLLLVERAHRSMPQLLTLGWDVAITDDGPVIIETNCRYDVDIIQVSHQQGFKSALSAALKCAL